jgi:hypothetical protein
MPKGPQGQKRPADTVANAIRVAKILTGEVEQNLDRVKSAAAELGARGGKARAAKMTAKRRTEIAKRAARARWQKAPTSRKR